MLLEDLATQYPDLWHVTFPGAWEGIQAEGFLRAIDVDPEGASAVRDEIRPASGPGGTKVVLRNQVPNRRDLTPSLVGVSTEEWWQLINGRVYFFVRQADAEALVANYLAQGHAQEVVKLRTRGTLAPVTELVELTTVNAGTFPRTSGPSRGPHTFVPLATFEKAALRKVQEVTVAGAMPLTLRAVSTVVLHEPSGERRRLFPMPT